MSLDYEFAPIDVRIEGHPKAWKAGPEAMGLWLWGMVHARQHKTAGVLDRASVLGAWGGKRNIMLAKRLVDAGLWLLQADGSWLIFNSEKKAAGASSSKERMRKLRAKRGEFASRDANSDVTCDAQCSVSVSSSISGSDLSQIASPPPPPGLGFPAWFDGACDAAAMTLGGTVADRPARWAEYEASRIRKGWAVGHKDAVGWLSAVLRSERERASSRPAARGAEITKQPPDYDAPWMKLPEVG